MFSNPILRLAVGIPLAALIVYILFLGMNALISSEYERPDVEASRTIDRITPQQDNQDVRARTRAAPQRIASADKPPPPPKLSASKSDIDLPTPNIQGSAPSELNFERVQALDLNVVAISDRDAQPIRPPLVTYPARAAERGIEGECSVRFDVDVRGRPYNVAADCSDSVFVREAERAVSRVEFAPKIVQGQARERRNVVYPVVFNLED